MRDSLSRPGEPFLFRDDGRSFLWEGITAQVPPVQAGYLVLARLLDSSEDVVRRAAKTGHEVKQRDAIIRHVVEGRGLRVLIQVTDRTSDAERRDAYDQAQIFLVRAQHGQLDWTDGQRIRDDWAEEVGTGWNIRPDPESEVLWASKV